MHRVLWIDDDKRLLAHAAEILSQRNIVVEFAPDIAAALDRLKAESWDRVIIDVGISAGDLETRHPEALGPLGFNHVTTGLDLAAYLTSAETSLCRELASLIICSGFERSYLDEAAPDLMPKLRYVSKASRTFMEGQFIGDLFEALEMPRPKIVTPILPVSEYDLPYVDLFHDLKNAVRSTIPSLSRVAERLEEHGGGKRGNLDELTNEVEKLGVDVANEAFDANGINLNRLDSFEDILAKFTSLRNDQNGAGKIDLVRLCDQLALRASYLPSLRSTEALLVACRALQLRICSVEIRTVRDRLQSGIEHLRPSHGLADALAFDSSSLLENILDLEEPNALAHRSGFERDIQPNVLIRTLEPNQAALYRRAIENIVNNAVKYQGRMPDNNTWIIAKHWTTGTYCRTSIQNWGPYIPEKELEDIFASGRRGQKARRQGEGRGLAIAFDCIKALGGRIDAKSRLESSGRGTNTFTVSLPLEPRSDD